MLQRRTIRKDHAVTMHHRTREDSHRSGRNDVLRGAAALKQKPMLNKQGRKAEERGVPAIHRCNKPRPRRKAACLA